MAKDGGLVLSGRDAPRIEKMLRWWERNYQSLTPQGRRRSISAGGGGGGGSEYVTVITGLSRVDHDDLDHYTVRLATDTTAAWSAETTYPAGAYVIKNNKKFISSQGNNLNHDPEEEQSTWWTQVDDIEIHKWYAHKDSSVDLRLYMPWFTPGMVIKVKKVNDVYYIDETLIYVGSELTASMCWSETYNRGRAVVV
jgi:hypothetical protein